MNISVEDDRLIVPATSVRVTDDSLIVDLEDGRQVSAPLVWYPRLLHGTAKERANLEIGHYGVHWPDLDEDISIKGLLLGNKSGESQTSLNRWLEFRRKGKKTPVKTLPLPAWAKNDSKKNGTGRSKQKIGNK
ncbi:MAG TPA: DUF2442 domain-containing protein [Tepidisphaeraceae bacterium]|nr:DUF2442 domain-containing protein [Tepidisphaeraceae bacterium]